jgi:hypothetical protein
VGGVTLAVWLARRRSAGIAVPADPAAPTAPRALERVPAR